MNYSDSSPFSLTNRHIVVSGASSGIGRQCAIQCAEAGASVSMLGRNEERLKETLSAMVNPEKHHIYLVDLTDSSVIDKTVRTIVEVSGLIHGILNAAGISATLLMRQVDEARLDEYFKNNVYSAFFLTKEVCKPGHFAKEGGSVVLFSSVMGSVGEAGKTLYSMTKGALIAGAKSMACEMAKRNIRVNTISPGVIITPINENLPHIADPEKRKTLEKMHLLGLGKTSDVANACIFLLSDASRWITGTNLVVDGGYTAR